MKDIPWSICCLKVNVGRSLDQAARSRFAKPVELDLQNGVATIGERTAVGLHPNGTVRKRDFPGGWKTGRAGACRKRHHDPERHPASKQEATHPPLPSQRSKARQRSKAGCNCDAMMGADPLKCQPNGVLRAARRAEADSSTAFPTVRFANARFLRKEVVPRCIRTEVNPAWRSEQPALVILRSRVRAPPLRRLPAASLRQTQLVQDGPQVGRRRSRP